MNFILDDEKNFNEDEDLLNFDKYIQNLEEIILNSPPDSSFTIGLFGVWGSGKSSIIKTVKSNFKNSKDIKFITYDAWKYSKDSFRRTFLINFQENMDFQKDLKNKFYNNLTQDIKMKHTFNKYILCGCLGAFIFPLIFFYLWGYYYNLLPNILSENQFIITFITALAPPIFSIIGLSKYSLKTSITEPYMFAPEQFEECFNNLINSSFNKEHLNKIVFVIDNVDRCTSSEVYELLLNIKTFLNIKKQIVFIIPLDDDALKTHFSNLVNSKFENNYLNYDSNIKFNEFFRKIFDVYLKIKKIENIEIKDFTFKLSLDYELNLSNDTLELISNTFVKNPRRIIQFLNNLQVELNNFDYNFAKDNQNHICKILIIREEYPNIYNYLHKNILKIQSLKNSKDKLNKQFGKEGNQFYEFISRNYFSFDINDFNIYNKIFYNFEHYKGIPKNIYNAINDENTELIKYYIDSKENKEIFKTYMNIEIEEYSRKHHENRLIKRIDLLIYFYKELFLKKLTNNTKSILKEYNYLLVENTNNIDNLVNFSKYLFDEGDDFLILLLISYVEKNVKGKNANYIKYIRITKLILKLFKNNDLLKYVDYLNYFFIGNIEKNELNNFFNELNEFQLKSICTNDLINNFIKYLDVDFDFALYNLTYFINIISKKTKLDVLIKIHKNIYDNFSNYDEIKTCNSLSTFLKKGDFHNVDNFRFDNSLSCIFYALKKRGCSVNNLIMIKGLMEEYIKTADNPEVFDIIN